jgi:hypothetical protein
LTRDFEIVTQVLSSGVSNYNGLALTFTRRWVSGVGQINYTYSHALDDVSNGGRADASPRLIQAKPQLTF